MTYIDRFWDSYMSFPKIYFLDDKFKFRSLTNLHLGVYDPSWGVETEVAYKPGKFLNEVGEPFYDDTVHKDKQCLVVSFQHRPLSNYPVFRRIGGGGHFHIQYFVSNNSIRPHDVMWQAEDGALLIFARLDTYPPAEITQPDGTEEILFEVTPLLSPEEMEGMAKDINFVVTIKEKYRDAEAMRHRLENENFIVTSRSLAAESTVILLQENVNTLLKSHQVALDKIVQFKLHAGEKIAKGIELVEGKYNFGAPWDHIAYEDTEKTAAFMQADIRGIEAMVKMGGDLSENQKQMLVLQVCNVVGVPYIKKFLLGVEQYEMGTPMGARKMTLSQQPTPTEMIAHYGRLYENGQISVDEYNKAIKGILDVMRSRVTKGEDVNSAIEEMREELLAKVRPEGVSEYGRRVSETTP